MSTFQLTRNLVIVILFIIVLTIGTKMLILDGGHYINLDPAPSLGGAVAQSLGPNSDGKLAVANRNFKLKDAHYFENQKWVVVKIVPIKENYRYGTVLLKKIDGVYQIVLGPDVGFSTSYRYVLPEEIVKFMDSQRLLRDE